jgi:ribonuclease R
MDLPFVFRVHEKPAPEKVEGFIAFLKILGIPVKWNAETCHPKDYQRLLETMRGEPIFNVVNKIMLRSMQKAKYSPENSGHFGLSSKCYCHFTSPIRRFPDLVVHKILKSILAGEDVLTKYSTLVQEASLISSQNERRADEAERTMDDFYKCRFMKKYIGYEFDAIVSGVTNFGVFVELDNTVEGLVRLEHLPRGKYELDERTYSLRSGKRSYTLGDRVKVLVLGVDTRARKIDMKITVDKNDKIW